MPTGSLQRTRHTTSTNREANTLRVASKAKAKGSKQKLPQLSAKNADAYELYTHAVQGPDHEIDFVTEQFKKLTGRPLRNLREDFSGAGASSAEFVKRHADNHAHALDISKSALAWGKKNTWGKLDAAGQQRLRLLERNVLSPGDAVNVDAILAMNFSYWIFDTRPALINYFKVVHKSLKSDGVFFADVYGGYESTKEMEERRRISVGKGRWFKYVWDQATFDPITNIAKCKIHFEFEKGPPMRNAFTYQWRVWTIPELRDMLAEAGFKQSLVYLEGDDGKGGGDGIFKPREKGDPDACFIGYLVATKK
jgi:SAM-dependent methyltransferase